MKRSRLTVLLLVAACSTFDGLEPRYQALPNWGACTVAVNTRGNSPYERYDYVVSLDSAIQGYGARVIDTQADTVVIEPILAGRHTIALRGVKPNCEVEGDSVRDLVMTAGGGPWVRFDVTCSP